MTGLVATTLRATEVEEKDLWAVLRTLGTDFLSMAAVVTDEVDDGDGGKEETEGELETED